MQNHKIIAILSAFDKVKCKRLIQFIRSPYHNPSKKVTDLGEYILSFHPEFSHKGFTEERAFNSLGLEKAFSKHELTRYLSKLFTVIEDFIAAEATEGFPLLKNSLIAEYYYSINNKSAFDKAQKQINKIVDKSEEEESVGLFYTYLNKKLTHNFLARQHLFKDSKPHIEQAITALNHYYFVQVMMTSVGVQNLFREAPDEKHFPILQHVLDYISLHLEEVPLLAKMYYLVFHLKEQPESKEAYYHLKQELRLNLRELPPKHAATFVIMMNNALARQVSLGRSRYLEERFETYLIEIQEGWIIAEGLIEYTNFNNVITTALALNKVDFAVSFIEEFHRYLPENSLEDILKYNQARLAFHKGNFGKCLEICQQVAFLDNRIALSIKRYQIMSFSELGEEEQLFNALNSMKVYVHRLPKTNAAAKKRNNAFLKAINILSKQPGQALKEQERNALESLLKEEPFMPEAEWIMEKMKRPKA